MSEEKEIAGKIEKPKKSERAALPEALSYEVKNNKLKIVILQHPQEPDKELGSAQLCAEILKNSVVKIGLSWPSLTKILQEKVDYSQWGVLYLGKVKEMPEQEAFFVSKKGNPIDSDFPRLKGLVILDGSWSQAKTLWWRNAWLLKLHRIVLNPSEPSLYKKLRREPRKSCLSTIEATALVLRVCSEAATAKYLKEKFSEFLDFYRK